MLRDKKSHLKTIAQLGAYVYNRFFSARKGKILPKEWSTSTSKGNSVGKSANRRQARYLILSLSRGRALSLSLSLSLFLSLSDGGSVSPLPSKYKETSRSAVLQLLQHRFHQQEFTVETQWLVPSRQPVNQQEVKLPGSSSPQRLHVKVHRPPVVSRSPIVTGPVLLLFVRSGDTRSLLSY